MSDTARTMGGDGTLVPGHLWSLPETIYWGVAVVMAAAFALTLVLLAVDARTIDGHVSVWAKPLKFEASLAIHAATLALVTGLLSPPHRQGSAMLVVALAFLAASTIEMGWIILQGARAEQSHFNVSTPFHSLMWSAMALCAVIIIGAAAALGLAALRDTGFAASPAVKASIVLGLVSGTVLTLITAFAIGGRMSPYVGGVPAFDARMMLTGWSRSGGDLRVSHFLATHMIQALPVFGLLANQIAPSRIALLAVLAFAAGWTGLTLMEFRAALAGKASMFALSIP